jgi:hypothetical protein
MRRISILLLVGLMLLLVGCGGKENDSIAKNDDNKNASEQNISIAEANNNEKANNSEADKDVIEVDKNLFSVEITIPVTMITDDDPEQIKAKAEQEDGIEVTINSDGSLTYRMSKAAHKRMMDEMKESLEETVNDIVNSGDYSSIKDIKVNKSYTEFTMVVDRKSYENSFDGFAALGLGMGSMFYQVFDGADAETVKATIHVEDSNTGEIFNMIVYPDDLYQLNEP